MAMSREAQDFLSLYLSSSRTARTALLLPPTTTIRSTYTQRSFSWGSKHKWSTGNHGRNMSDKVKITNISRQGFRYPYLERQMFVRRILPSLGWRSASHWKKSNEKEDDRESTQPQRQPEIEEGDWYSQAGFSRWEKLKRQQYEEFKKKVEQDPFDALFGRSNRWLGWTAETIARGAAKSEGQANVLKMKAEEYLRNDKARKAMKETPDPVTVQEFASWSSQSKSVHIPVKQDTESQEYDIDPITLRKVPKKAGTHASAQRDATKTVQQSFDIPIKTFKPIPRTSTTTAKGQATSQVDDWLGREGFGSTQKPQKPMASSEYGTSVGSKAPASKIESSLDRHVNGKDIKTEKTEPSLNYEPKENRTEDIDLLRASDVRAAAGKGGRPARESDLAREARRQTLEDRYQRQQQWLKEDMKREDYPHKDVEVLSSGPGDCDSAATNSLSQAVKDINSRYQKEFAGVSAPPEKPSSANAAPAVEINKIEKLSSFVNDKALQIQTKILPLKAQIDLMKAEYDALRQRWLEETRRMKEKAKKLHEEEVSAQKAAMEAAEHRFAGDMAPKVGMFASNKAKSLSMDTTAVEEHRGEGDMCPNVVKFASIDRWYKRKAPHANCEMDAKMAQLAKDMALVREVRGIYEDTYGVIDTKHRQEEQLGEGDMSRNVTQFASRDRWYKQKAPVKAVDDVSKVKPDVAYTMVKENFSADLLKQDATDAHTTFTSVPPSEQQSTQRLDQSATLSTTDAQIVKLKAQLDEQNAALKKQREEIENLRSIAANSDHIPDNVRRTEPVFSGQRHRKEKKRAGRRRKTFKHVILTGGVTAAMCYAMGVAMEEQKGFSSKPSNNKAMKASLWAS